MNVYKGKIFLILVLSIHACVDKKQEKLRTALIGERNYGGVLIYSMRTAPSHLFPLSSFDPYSNTVIRQIYEGLVKLSPSDLSVMPSLAEEWEINDSATVYLFRIRKGVKFHDDLCFHGGKGREINAHDIKYCFDKVCEDSPLNHSYWILKDKIKGAQEYFQSTSNSRPLKEGVSGIKIVDNYTLKIELTNPNAVFLSTLTMPALSIYPHEAVAKYKDKITAHCIGTGPFKLSEFVKENSIFLIRNENYWDKDEWGNPLPYLDGVKIEIIKDPKVVYHEFRKGKIHITSHIPFELITNIKKEADAGEFTLQKTSSLKVYFLGFNHSTGIFSNLLIRKSFNYAINRKAITNYIGQGNDITAEQSIIPPGINNFPYHKIKKYSYDPELAKAMLAQAGYPQGKGFPNISLYTSSSNEKLGPIVQNMLKENLGINISIIAQDHSRHYNQVFSGNADFWSMGWEADYPDPETFLTIFYGANIPANPHALSPTNMGRYKSRIFDSLYTLSIQKKDIVQRFDLYASAIQLCDEDVVVIPLRYREICRIVQNDVENSFINAMDYINFTTLYFSNSGRE